jgi:aminopeptidase N
MNLKRVLISQLLILLSFISCTENTNPVKKKAKLWVDNQKDDHSYSNINQISTKHLHLDLEVNFKNKTIYGVARHDFGKHNSDTVIFDIKHLQIQKITSGKKGNEKELSFEIGSWDMDSILGQPLIVVIKNQDQYINIYYQTTSKTEALDWLDPIQTQGKKHPLLYTQGQPILTRTWIPLQDSPINRFTYTADVKVPKELLALMSAENPVEKNDLGKYHFSMKQPIPSYLIALSVGDYQYKEISSKCGTYAESNMIGAAEKEFEDLPKMIDVAEKLYGPYRWGKYDVLVLPYAFPYGGMENPRLTFVNPTIIAGDKSLVSVIAHELAHSWSGNLVTNRTWNDFWLNEGFTVYFEHRIMEEIENKEYSDMLALIEFGELKEEIKEFKKQNKLADTHLKLDLKSRNPGDGLTQVAYIKGAFFLKTLEETVGREKMDEFLKKYFNEFAFQTISTEKFIEYLKEKLLGPNKVKFNFDEWIFQAGIPKNCIRIESQRFKEMRSLAKKFAEGNDIFEPKTSYEPIPKSWRKKRVTKQIKRSDFSTQEWVEFIRALPKTITPERLAIADAYMNFSRWGNAEVMTEWYVLSIKSNYKPAFLPMEQFIAQVGRRKYLLPIYSELNQTAENRLLALSIFDYAKFNYHYVSKSSIEKLLGI